MPTTKLQDRTHNEGVHQPELDGVRGLAIVAVMLSHGVGLMGVVPHEGTGVAWADLTHRIFLPGWAGVDLFFTLSGFLITGILLRTRESPRYYRAFYMRRVLRIFPIYYLFLVGLLVAGVFSAEIASGLPATALQRFSYFVYLQNWPAFWTSWMGLTGFWGVYWSLAVEEQFYLVWPALVRALSVRTMLRICVVGFLLGWPERVWMFLNHSMEFGMMQWPFSRLDGLFLGAALALYAAQAGRPVPKRWLLGMVGVGVGLYGWLWVAHAREMEGAGGNMWTTGVTAFALLSAGLVGLTQHRIGWLRRLLTLPPLVVAGRLSYGMYVYHLVVYHYVGVLVLPLEHTVFAQRWPVAYASGAILLAMAATGAVAAVSFRVIEQPALRLKRLFVA